MFKHLAELLPDKKGLLTLTIARSGDNQLTVCVIPKHIGEDSRKGLSTPLQLVATPEELDAEFPVALTRYHQTRVTVSASIEEAERELKKAEEEQKAKAAAARAKTRKEDTTKGEAGLDKAKENIASKETASASEQKNDDNQYSTSLL
jgi:PRTRC genetic system protein E